MIPKFRFFNINMNEIYEVVIVDFLSMQVDCFDNNQYSDLITWNIKDGTLMQWTGITNKNGEEIFEGDIVKNAHGDIGYIKNKGYTFVFTQKDKEGDYLIDSVVAPLPFKVIGNIYENKELLEVE